MAITCRVSRVSYFIICFSLVKKNDEIHLDYPSSRYMSLELLLKGNCRAPGAVKDIIENAELHKLLLEKLESNYTTTWHWGKEVGKHYAWHYVRVLRSTSLG